MLTSLQKLPTCHAPRSCSRLAPRWWPRPIRFRRVFCRCSSNTALASRRRSAGLQLLPTYPGGLPWRWGFSWLPHPPRQVQQCDCRVIRDQPRLPRIQRHRQKKCSARWITVRAVDESEGPCIRGTPHEGAHGILPHAARTTHTRPRGKTLASTCRLAHMQAWFTGNLIQSRRAPARAGMPDRHRPTCTVIALFRATT